MRVSGGHLCEAETPTEPAGETASPYKLSRLYLQLQRSSEIIQYSSFIIHLFVPTNSNLSQTKLKPQLNRAGVFNFMYCD